MLNLSVWDTNEISQKQATAKLDLTWPNKRRMTTWRHEVSCLAEQNFSSPPTHVHAISGEEKNICTYKSATVQDHVSQYAGQIHTPWTSQDIYGTRLRTIEIERKFWTSTDTHLQGNVSAPQFDRTVHHHTPYGQTNTNSLSTWSKRHWSDELPSRDLFEQSRQRRANDYELELQRLSVGTCLTHRPCQQGQHGEIAYGLDSYQKTGSMGATKKTKR